MRYQEKRKYESCSSQKNLVKKRFNNTKDDNNDSTIMAIVEIIASQLQRLWERQ